MLPIENLHLDIKSARNVLARIYNILKNDLKDTVAVTIQSDIKNYTSIENAVKFDSEKLVLEFSVGSYNFYTNCHFNITNETYSVVIYTYEKITQLHRTLDPKIEKYHPIKQLRFSYSQNKWYKHDDAEIGIVQLYNMYISGIVEYIHHVEHTNR